MYCRLYTFSYIIYIYMHDSIHISYSAFFISMEIYPQLWIIICMSILFCAYTSTALFIIYNFVYLFYVVSCIIVMSVTTIPPTITTSSAGMYVDCGTVFTYVCM